MLFAAIFCQTSNAQTVSPDVRVSPGPGLDTEPSVAVSGNVLVAVWGIGGETPCFDAALTAYSTDGGASWSFAGQPPAPYPRPPGRAWVCADDTGRFYLTALTCLAVIVQHGEVGSNGLEWQPPVEVVSSTTDGFDTPRITCDRQSGSLYLTYTRFSPYSSAFSYLELVRSTDGGLTWSAPLVLSSQQSAGGRPEVGPEGELYLVWHDYGSREIVGRRSLDSGASFEPAFVVAPILDNLGSPPPGLYPYNYRTLPTTMALYAAPDFPSLAIDRTSGPMRGTLYVSWSEHVAGEPAPATADPISEREPNESYGSATPLLIGQDVYGLAVTVDADPDGDTDVFRFEGVAGTIVWLDAVVDGTIPTVTRPVWLGPCTVVCDTLAYYAYLARGDVWDTRRYGPIQPILFTLPATGSYYVLVGGEVPEASVQYHLRLREWIPTPGQAAQDQRDIVLASSSDGGQSWSPKLRVNDSPPRFDDCYPDVVVDGLGLVHVAWYDRRDDPACGHKAHTYWTWSGNGGQSFAPSKRLSSYPSPWLGALGDHLAVAAEGERAFVLWTQMGQPDFDIFAVRIDTRATGVAVPRFSAQALSDRVRLLWTVQDALGIVGFRLHRALGESQVFLPLSADPLPSRGEGEYVEEDRDVSPGQSYRYRLEVLRASAASQWEGPVRVSLPGLVLQLSWTSVAPNPFAESVQMVLAAPRPDRAQVRVFDVTGHEVASLYEGMLPAGTTSLTWDGRDRQGHAVPAGIYLLHAQVGGETATRRLIRMH